MIPRSLLSSPLTNVIIAEVAATISAYCGAIVFYRLWFIATIVVFFMLQLTGTNLLKSSKLSLISSILYPCPNFSNINRWVSVRLITSYTIYEDYFLKPFYKLNTRLQHQGRPSLGIGNLSSPRSACKNRLVEALCQIWCF